MAASTRGAFGIVALILLAGSIVLLFFVVLSGVTNSTPLNKTYFLSADTSGITGARPISQWTFFYVCGAGNTDCGSPVPDLPIGYAWVGNTAGAPSAMVGSHGKGTTSTYYYYMWRFGWVFYLMGLILDVFGFFAALAAPFSRLASAFSGLIILGALFFFSLGASLMTAAFVKARNALNANGNNASIGRYAMGFTWGAWTAMAIAAILLFGGCIAGGRRDTTTSVGGTGYRRFFGRQRSRRSAHHSFVDNESQRRVKEEYS